MGLEAKVFYRPDTLPTAIHTKKSALITVTEYMTIK